MDRGKNQMIIKSSSLLYLFDFDGTLSGSNDWNGYIKNFLSCFRTIHFNPNKLDIRWSILTSRPKIDLWFIKTVCRYHKLSPAKILLSNSWVFNFKNRKEESDFKSSVIKAILDGKIDMRYSKVPITKVCYIDNDVDILKHMNSNRSNYAYLAMSVADFMTKDFTNTLLG